MAKGRINFEETSRIVEGTSPAELFGAGVSSSASQEPEARPEPAHPAPSAPSAQRGELSLAEAEQKVRVFTDVTMLEVDKIDQIVATRQKGQAKIVKRARIIRELILEGLKHIKV